MVTKLENSTNKLKVLAFILFFLCLLNNKVYSADNDTLFVFSKSSIYYKTIPMDNLEKITFVDDKMIFWESDKKTEFDLSLYDFLSFDKDNNPLTRIEVIKRDNNINVYYKPSEDCVIVESDNVVDGVELFSISGQTIGYDKSKSKSYRLSTNKFIHGVFIVKVVFGTYIKSWKFVK